jgi:hypothetical protein
MHDADLLVLLGSTHSHYTASKVFPYWLSGKPILGIFHRHSTVVQIAEELGGIRLVTFDESTRPESTVSEVSNVLKAATSGGPIAPDRLEEGFQPYSSDGIAERYASLFDRVLESTR